MLNVNYGNIVSEETKSQIAMLLEGEGCVLNTGISPDVISDMMDHSGEKVLNIVMGDTIDAASRCLPSNLNEHLNEAVVLIKVRPDYHFLPMELVALIRYFDAYPKDPKITWRYCLDSAQEQPVTIIILKNIKK